MNNILQNELLTNQKLSQLLSVTTRTLQTYRDKGMIEFIQIGRKVYYSNEAVETFLNSHKVKPFELQGKGGVYA